jgi:hypothetical protein
MDERARRDTPLSIKYALILAKSSLKELLKSEGVSSAISDIIVKTVFTIISF